MKFCTALVFGISLMPLTALATEAPSQAAPPAHLLPGNDSDPQQTEEVDEPSTESKLLGYFSDLSSRGKQPALDRIFHLPQHTLQMRLGFGLVQRFGGGQVQPASELGLRWGFLKNLEYAFPLILSLRLPHNDRRSTILTTGVSGFGFGSDNPWSVEGNLGAAHVLKLSPQLALVAHSGAVVKVSQRIPLQSLQLGIAGGFVLNPQERIHLALFFTARDQLSYDNTDTLDPEHQTTLMLGSMGTGWSSPPTIRIRVIWDLNIYWNSVLAVAMGSTPFWYHSHKLGILWYL